MIRKRASFKPNLSKVSSDNGTPTRLNASSTVSTPDAPTNKQSLSQTDVSSDVNTSPTKISRKDDTVSHAATSNSNVLEVRNTSTTNTKDSLEASASELNTPPKLDVSASRVQAAINQLTGPKIEPIKSLSLRNSANKDMKLKDLLFFNPPMTKDQKRHKKSVLQAKKSELRKSNDVDAPQSQQSTHETATTNASSQETQLTDIDQHSQSSSQEDEHNLVPKVKIGPEGKLILDESSTIINRRNAIKDQEAIIEDNDDVVSKTNYDSFRRRPSNTSQTKWSSEDTRKFYHALAILGTDFSLMESLLFAGSRSRAELHKKFKREERVNKIKIDIALTNRISLNSEELDDLREIFYDK